MVTLTKVYPTLGESVKARARKITEDSSIHPKTLGVRQTVAVSATNRLSSVGIGLGSDEDVIPTETDTWPRPKPFVTQPMRASVLGVPREA